MICGRCDQPIRPGEPYDVFVMPGASRSGVIVHLHAVSCPTAGVRKSADGGEGTG